MVSRVVGFKKIKFYTNENVGSGELDLPEQQMHTTAYWLTIPASTMALLPYASDDRRDGVMGIAYAIRQMAQLLLMCDGHDIGISVDTGEQVQPSDRRVPELAADKSPRIFVYDNYPGGIGFSEPLFRMDHELLTGTRRLIAECVCENGCPGCVGPMGNTGPLAKAAALRILDLLLGTLAGGGCRRVGGVAVLTTLADRIRDVIRPPGPKGPPDGAPGPAGPDLPGPKTPGLQTPLNGSAIDGLQAVLGGRMASAERRVLLRGRDTPRPGIVVRR